MRLGEAQHWTVGAVEVTRVPDPDFELVLPQDPGTAAVLDAAGWLRPTYVTADWSLRIGSSATLLRTPSATIVVDPFLTFDDPARLAPRLAALRSAGVDPAEVDLVVCSHIDGIGASVLADGSPTFPHARYLFPPAELEDATAGSHGAAGQVVVGLQKEGRAEPVFDGDTPVPGVRVEDAPGHSRGHVVVWVDSGGAQAVVVGHLFLHPAQIAHPEVHTGDRDPAVLQRTRRALLCRCADTGALLVGPLFARPGGGRVEPDGDRWRLGPWP